MIFIRVQGLPPPSSFLLDVVRVIWECTWPMVYRTISSGKSMHKFVFILPRQVWYQLPDLLNGILGCAGWEMRTRSMEWGPGATHLFSCLLLFCFVMSRRSRLLPLYYWNSWCRYAPECTFLDPLQSLWKMERGTLDLFEWYSVEC